ncbi:MAG TPA: alpha/beta hydrolase [Ilumatobacteraceae bacterium]|nr:alpha/beta hydrolase [Ilumatobacteraceae bacterium]
MGQLNELVYDFGAPETILPSGVRVHHGVEFASVEGYRPLLLDLYVPPPAAASGASIVYLHGGGWAVGTRRRFGRAFASWSPTPLDLLAQAGFAVATVDYRLSAEARFPAQLHDVKAAIRWLRGHAASVMQLDTAKVLVRGESAGGHLAMLAGLTAGRQELEGDVGDHLGESSVVCGVVDWYGPMNLLSLSAQHAPDSDKRPDDAGSWESSLVGAPLQSDPARTAAASPISYVHAGAPPIQIHHGTNDTLVPFAQSVEFVDALHRVGADAEFIPVQDSDHFWAGAASIQEIFDASSRFATQASTGRSA